jgi:cellulose biosynthesis protein BcsQ
MKLVSFASLKGGAGKTTGLMVATGGLLRRGKVPALFEGDEEDPVKFWRSNALDNGTWDKRCKIFEASDQATFAKSHETAVREGYEIALFDLEGGQSELNTTAIINSDLILIPVSLTALDVEYGIQTMKFVRHVLQENDLDTKVAFLLCRFPPSEAKLTKSDRESLRMLDPLPQTTTRLPTRAVYGDMAVSGMLNLYHEGLAKDPALRVMTTNTRIALKEAEALADDILEVVMSKEEA